MHPMATLASCKETRTDAVPIKVCNTTKVESRKVRAKKTQSGNVGREGEGARERERERRYKQSRLRRATVEEQSSDEMSAQTDLQRSDETTKGASRKVARTTEYRGQHESIETTPLANNATLAGRKRNSGMGEEEKKNGKEMIMLNCACCATLRTGTSRSRCQSNRRGDSRC